MSNATAATAPSSVPDSTRSYQEILRATAVTAGSFLVVLCLSMLRMKVVALMLGPDGIGHLGLLTAVLDMAIALAGLGIQAGGVRQIAEMAGRGEQSGAATIAGAIRWASLATGLAGALALVILAMPVSALTFGSEDQTASIIILGGAVLLRLVAAGQASILQGTRRIGDLAIINIAVALVTTLAMIPAAYLWGEAGMAGALLVAAAGNLAATNWFCRRVALNEHVPWPAAKAELPALLRLGVAFMVSGLVTFGVAYLVRIIVLRSGGLAEAGLYQAAWAIAGLYASFVLQAMSTDFYPRLAGMAADNAGINRLVNEQTRISVLLAGPGMIATITLAPFVLEIFYSSDFAPADVALRWMCMGMALRIVAWPMGFIVLAKGAQRIFFWTEVAAGVVHVTLALLLVPHMGIAGTGAAFCGLYLWHTGLIYFIVHRLSGFTMDRATLRLSLVSVAGTALAFAGFYLLSFWWAVALGSSLTALAGLAALRTILPLVGPLSGLVDRLKWHSQKQSAR